MMSWKNVFLGFLGLILVGASCTAPEDIQIERETVDLAFPIFSSETTMSDLIGGGQDSGALVVYGDNHMALQYATSTSVGIPMPVVGDFEAPLVPGQTVLPNSAVDGVLIKGADFESGQMTFHFEKNAFSDNITIAILINEIRRNGIPFQKTVVLDSSSTGGLDLSYDLSEYSIDMSQNDLTVEYSAESSGSSTTLDVAKFGMKEVLFSVVKGEWDTKTIPVNLPDLKLDFFDHYYNGGVVTFTNPIVQIIAQNTAGIATKLNYNEVLVQRASGDYLPVSGSFVDNGFVIAHPSMGHIGTTQTSQSAMNKDNSNILEVFESDPKSVSYDMDLVLNPEGVHEGFLTKDSKVNIDVAAMLPFTGMVDNFEVSKSFDVKFSNEHIEAASIKLQAINQIPLDARIQMYFIDNAGVKLDSIVSSDGVLAIKGAEVSTDGSILHTSIWEEEIPISQVKWDRIKTANHVELVTFFTSSSHASVPVTVKTSQIVILNAGLKLTVLP